MLILLQIITIVGMVALSYLLFQSFGSPRKTLLYTSAERHAWDRALRSPLGSLFTQANIVGTMMLFATVYLFFIGSSKLFGYWVFWCAGAIVLGALITNRVTLRLCSNAYIGELMRSPDQVAGVIASVFWRDNVAARQTAAIVKWLSIVNIAAIIWLDFALFADIAGRLLLPGTLWFQVCMLCFACGTIFFFTMRYGLRGFVFADLFQSPTIILATLVLLIGSGIAVVNGAGWPAPAQFFSPILPQYVCILFVVHVTFLNGLSVLTTEPHWLRVWVFQEKETQLQFRSLLITAVAWVVLMLVGLLASHISNGRYGEDAVVGILSRLSVISPIFIVAFWIGGVAALFSSADAQIYSLLLVSDFDTKTGRLRQRLMTSLNPFRMTLIFTAIFVALYAATRVFNLPFEKIIFIIVPFSLNCLPAFARAFIQRPQMPIYIVSSLVLYCSCAIVGLLRPTEEFTWTLAAAIMPVVVTLVALWRGLSSPLEKEQNVA